MAKLRIIPKGEVSTKIVLPKQHGTLKLGLKFSAALNITTISVIIYLLLRVTT